MELGELVVRRPFPAAGLLLGLTRRCPLSCAHCSTGSGMTVRERPDAGQLARFVGSFTPDDRPDVVMLTGGEPLLLPGLVEELSTLAHSAGARTALLSGMFFARSRRIPAPLLRAITAVDHFSASLDVHHEREIPRADVFRALHRIRETGVAVSFHLTGSGTGDPYLADITRDIEEEFGGRVPSLVNEVRPFGRAAAWAAPARTVPDTGPVSPCAMAAWPVVAFDGTVLACCNQDTVDLRPVPDHLHLGHIATDDWAAVRRRTQESPVLRMIRTVGPAHLSARSGTPPRGTSYCEGCRALGGGAHVTAAGVATGAAGALLDLAAARQGAAGGAVGVVRRHGCAAYAPLVTAGAAGAADAPAAGAGDVRTPGGAR
ncbi:radical SAM protein [Streptomyces sp. B1I3]|uniref:radical SAM protein n=1 Tax=Streptomyces sp. B1I3 TaxID=3042264 RepID=UPI00277D6C76|nr:radical SAM protein [Streptomyces sp. B1I3]MDQ0796285.1 pyruvate-formate lyase-activating enzyme [Streptomyces sp. B1I3]